MNRYPFLYALLGVLGGSAATVLVLLLTLKPLAQVAPSTPGTTASPLSSPPTATWRGMMGQTDQHFIVMMIPHHEDAIAMAELALSKAQHAELKQLAQAIKTTQTQENQQMRTWYKQWYGTDVPLWGPGNRWGWYAQNNQQNNNKQPIWGPGMGQYRNWEEWNQQGSPGMMRGMMGNRGRGTNLYTLQNAPDFDREFIQQMIPHHQMGVMMASMALNSTQRTEIRDLAQSIIKGQTAEINKMQEWYQKWYP